MFFALLETGLRGRLEKGKPSKSTVRTISKIKYDFTLKILCFSTFKFMIMLEDLGYSWVLSKTFVLDSTLLVYEEEQSQGYNRRTMCSFYKILLE